jgi:hypothetical protein
MFGAFQEEQLMSESKHANVPAWAKELDSREWSQILHAQAYAKDHQSAGAPGHGQFLLLAKLAKLLDAREPHENGGE